MAQFFLFLSVGYGSGAAGILHKSVLPDLGKLLTKILIPVMIFFSIYSDNSLAKLTAALPIFPAAVVFYLLLALILKAASAVLRLPPERSGVFRISFLFGNTGFVGIPLITSLFPANGMSFFALFSIVDQFALWTYGVFLVQAGKGRKISLRSFINPASVSILLAILFVCTGIRLPSVLDNTVSALSKAASVLCMIYLGAMVRFTDLRPVIRKREVYYGIGIKQILFPLLSALLLSAVGIGGEMRGVLVVLSTLPTMTAVPIIVKNSGSDGDYAAGIAVMTFISSLFLIPLSVWVTGI